MDTKKPPLQWRKAELIDRIEQSRRELAHHLDSTARSLNVASAIRRSWREDTWKWLGMALVTGLVLAWTRRPLREKSAQKLGAGLLGFVLQSALGLAQPYLVTFLQRTVDRCVDLAGRGLREEGLLPGRRGELALWRKAMPAEVAG